MSQAGIINMQQNPALPDIQTVTGNNAVAVGPDAGFNLNLVGAGGVTVTGNAGTHTLTVSVAGSGMTWNTISTSQTLKINNGYFCTGGAALSLLLPAVSSLGDEIEISLDGSTSFTVTQAAGQSIKFGQNVTTTGGGGSLASSAQGDTLRIVCSVANLRWNVMDSIGNLVTV